ncbi:MAG: amidohydrolase [Bacillota bacterium]
MKADIIFTGGTVITVNGTDDIASACAVAGDRIVFVGDDAGAEELRGPDTRVISLAGRTLLPGFVEAHCHVMGWGSHISGLDLKTAASVGEIVRMVADRAETLPPGSWIRGRGYNQLNLAEKRHPTRWDLDEAAPDHPVWLTRCCGHILVANSLALQLGGLADDSPDPPGGVMDRDESGRLTGVLRETAREPVAAAGALPPSELREHYVVGCSDLLRWGITSAYDMGRSATVRDMMSWHVEEEIPLRVSAVVSNVQDAELWPDRGGDIHFLQVDGRFRIGHMKVFVDGSSSGPTAATREPYACDPEDCGVVVTPQEEITSLYVRANRLGFSLTAHAVGDRGIEMTITGQELAMRDRPRRGLSAGYPSFPRHRIEHCAMAFPDLRRRLKAASVIPVAQPIFMADYGDNYINDYGSRRAAAMFPLRSFLSEGIPVALGSDAPVSHPNPLASLEAACRRMSRGGKVLGEEERITLLEAIRCHTLHGAYAEFAEDVRGSIEVGKLADLAVVGAPLLEVDPAGLSHCEVDMTVIGGQVVHERS